MPSSVRGAYQFSSPLAMAASQALVSKSAQPSCPRSRTPAHSECARRPFLAPPLTRALPSSVTSVGATGADVDWADEAAVPFSSGGFSNYFPRPAYQDAAVRGYLTLLGSNDTGLYNASGRGFPDISAFGVEYATIVDGAYQGATGTSCSTPMWASVIALLNDERLKAGKPVLGFLNPWLYAKAAGALTDIVKGNNKECLESDGTVAGFVATPGWDPVSPPVLSTKFGSPS